MAYVKRDVDAEDMDSLLEGYEESIRFLFEEDSDVTDSNDGDSSEYEDDPLQELGESGVPVLEHVSSENETVFPTRFANVPWVETLQEFVQVPRFEITWRHPEWPYVTRSGLPRREPLAPNYKYSGIIYCLSCGALNHHKTRMCPASIAERRWYATTRFWENSYYRIMEKERNKFFPTRCSTYVAQDDRFDTLLNTFYNQEHVDFQWIIVWERMEKTLGNMALFGQVDEAEELFDGFIRLFWNLENNLHDNNRVKDLYKDLLEFINEYKSQWYNFGKD